MFCELCGRETNQLYLVEIEGSKLMVCEKCKGYGKFIKKITNFEEPKKEQKKETKEIGEKKTTEIFNEDSYDFVDNYGKLIKQKREEMGLTQEQFAKLLNERESIIHKIENQEIEPSYNLAKKIEKKLGIKILTKTPNYAYSTKDKTKAVLTLGDVIKIKKKQSKK